MCVMSGDFVQRGEPAIFSKFARAEAAVRCGADLVVELPLPWCMASAERFAHGAIHILGSLGVVDYLSFGSESGDITTLEQVADCLDSELFRTGLSRFLDEGMPFAACRQAVVRGIMGPEPAALLAQPNDNLGVEYLKGIRRGGFPMKPIAVKRMGAGHDERTDDVMKSGFELRSMLRNGENTVEHLPEAAYNVFAEEIRQSRGPVTLNDLEPMVLSRLRMLDKRAFAVLPDATEGLEGKLYAACEEENSLEGIYARAKSKRYTHSRIRRMTMYAALGLTKDLFDTAPGYVRILALNERGRSVLKRAKKTAMIEIINKPAFVRDLAGSVGKTFVLTAKAHDLYVLGYKNTSFRTGNQDWKASPRYIY